MVQDYYPAASSKYFEKIKISSEEILIVVKRTNPLQILRGFVYESVVRSGQTSEL